MDAKTAPIANAFERKKLLFALGKHVPKLRREYCFTIIAVSIMFKVFFLKKIKKKMVLFIQAIRCAFQIPHSITLTAFAIAAMMVIRRIAGTPFMFR